LCTKALKARNKYWLQQRKLYVAPSALQDLPARLPGALPQAVALRTFGAEF